MPTFATPGPVTATVEVAGAQVRVTASERPDTVVRVDPIDGTSRKDLKVAEKTEVGFADGQLSVKTTSPGDKRGSVAITIDLPTGSGLVAHLAYSAVNAEGALGASELHMSSGQARLEHLDALEANIASGEVAIGRVAGRAKVDGAAFALRIGEVGGTVVLRNSGGQTWIGHVAADLDLSSAGGSFDVDRADGSVAAETASGGIRIGRMTDGRARLRTASGDIEVGVSEGSAASIDVDSERGAVHDYVSSAGEPGRSDARVSVHARTRHGDITVQRAAAELTTRG